MKYKILDSVAHNLGHSFFSLMNGSGGRPIIDHFFEIAKRTKLSNIKIDFLNQVIGPKEFRSIAILQALKNHRDYFPTSLIAQNCTMNQIAEVEIGLNFDLSKRLYSETVKSLELAIYDCEVKIVDDRGKVHVAKVPEWWKY